MLLSYVFSFRNEAGNIPELVTRVSNVSKSIEDINYELIFVNDDSNDGSLQLLENLQLKYPITIINMSRRFGVTPCVLAGLAIARGDAVIYMDSDLQDPPEIIPEMVDLYRKGADVVHTTRTHRDGEGLIKIFITKCAYSIINLLSEVNLPQNTGDFKLLSSVVVKNILELNEFDPYMRGLSVWVGFRQEFVPYRRKARHAGITKFPLLSRGPINEFVRGITAYSAAPLYLSFFLGLLTISISILLMIWALVSKLYGISTPGTSGILIAIAFFSGVILTTNGLLAIYLAKIFYHVKRRPNYIVKNIIYPPLGSDMT